MRGPTRHAAAVCALQAEVRGAHEASIWAATWHPMGHLLATGAADYCFKFWCRWATCCAVLGWLCCAVVVLGWAYP